MERQVMITSKTEKSEWRCTSDETGVVICSILVTFLILSWAYIPA
jgi:hypothetical protein